MTDLPQRVSLLWEESEVLVCKLQGRKCVQPKVGPAFQEVSQISERIQTQAIVPIVGKMGHKYTDLQRGRKREIEFPLVRHH